MKSLLMKCILALLLTNTAFAGEQGHYVPAPIGARDFAMPPPGSYLNVYDMHYGSDAFKDKNGDTLKSISSSGTITRNISVQGQSIPVTITGNVNVDLALNVNVFMQMMAFVWAPDLKILGADYAFLIMPSWGYSRVDIKAKANAVGTISAGGISKPFNVNAAAEIEDATAGFGDLYVQPFWLDWRGKHYDAGVSYGVWAPTGTYDKNDIANIGLGFLTQEVQANVYYYPLESKATALFIRPTYEWNSRKIDTDVQPGQDITLEYGLSQFIHPRAELAVIGYQQWQISGDHGSAARNKDVFDMVNGIGAQITCWAVENKCAIVGKFSKELGAKDRLQGAYWSLNVTWIF